MTDFLSACDDIRDFCPVGYDGVVKIEAPESWNAGWVCHRMVVAFEIERVSPARIGPSLYGPSWFEYQYTADDILSQKEMPSLKIYADKNAISEAARREMELRNRSQPSNFDILMSNEAMRWPYIYLKNRPELMEAINAFAEAVAREIPLLDFICKKKEFKDQDVDQQRLDAAQIISAGLTRDRVEVGRYTGRV